MNETTVTIAIAAALQIGTLIYFLGGLKTTVQDHGKRLDAVEAKAETTALTVATLKGEMRA